MALIGQTIEDIAPRPGPHLGSVQVILLDSERRGIHSKDLMIQWEKEIGAIPGVKSLTFSGFGAGPAGAPIEVWLQGRDMNDIFSAADDLMDRLRMFEGVFQIHSDFSPGKNEMWLELKPEARTLGLTVETWQDRFMPVITGMRPSPATWTGRYTGEGSLYRR